MPYLCPVKSNKAALIILDGLGYGKQDHSNAVYKAHTPYLDYLLSNCPHATLQASGEAVGLPKGQMGNSEVGHINLGAGRIVYQELGRIHKIIAEGGLQTHAELTKAFEYARDQQKKVHFIGLLSDGGVHSHIDHLKGLCLAAQSYGLTQDQVFIHGFLDGRDTDPLGGLGYVRDLFAFLENKSAQIATLGGRYFAMDRDNRWERIQVAYEAMVHGVGLATTNFELAIQASYAAGVTDEFMKPIIMVNSSDQPLATIIDGDVVICFNFRTDRGREITSALTQRDYPDYDMKALKLYYLTMTNYDDSFKDVHVIFQKENLNNTLGEILEQHGKTQVRIAETEKYPHVTFFFSGGRELPFQGEHRILIPSPKVATYDLKPEMSAGEITRAIIDYTQREEPDFFCLNFANPDMVGHTGVFSAVVKAVETVDTCLKEVVENCKSLGYSMVILADHGNADYMINSDNSPNTAHTTNLVPFILVDSTHKEIKDGKLGDIAPTILKLMNLPVPDEMSGNILV